VEHQQSRAPFSLGTVWMLINVRMIASIVFIRLAGF
jgi:hypothetical protein